MKRTTRNASKSRETIVKKAAPVFNINGYAGTTMQMLVDATGYQMGGIYRHYDSKMDLAREVFQYNVDTLIKPNLEMEGVQSADEKLFSIIRNYRKMATRPKIPGGCPILNTAIEVDDTNESFRELTAAHVEEIITFITSIIEEGENEGCFQPDLDARKEAMYLFASFEGAILLAKLSRDPQSIFNILDQVENYIKLNLLK